MKINEQQFIGLTEQRAIELARQNGIIYRSIKPHMNIMLTEDNRLDRVNFIIQNDIVVNCKVY